MNLYEILGLQRGAFACDVRSAYLKKAKQTHPDAGGDVAAFKEITRAYGVLGDAQKRIVYDQTGQESSAPSTEDAAIIILRNMVESIIADNANPAITDFMQRMRTQIAQAIASTDAQRADIMRKADRCKAIAGRFKAKSGENLISKMFEARAAEINQMLAASQRDIANLEAARELLNAYSYKVDAAKSQVRYDPVATAAFVNTFGGAWR